MSSPGFSFHGENTVTFPRLNCYISIGLGEGAAEGFAQMADYIEEQGLLIHGFTCFKKKGQLLQVLEDEEIIEIYVGDEY